MTQEKYNQSLTETWSLVSLVYILHDFNLLSNILRSVLLNNSIKIGQMAYTEYDISLRITDISHFPG